MLNQIAEVRQDLEKHIITHWRERFREEKETYSWENIVGVGVGIRVKHGKITDEGCLKVYVARKVSVQQVDQNCLFARQFNIPVDVEPVGEVIAAVDGNGYIPNVPLGVSLGHMKTKGGTLGCFVGKPDNPSKSYLLSCNHVIAAENAGLRGHDKIIQPGVRDQGTSPRNDMATLVEYEQIKFGPGYQNEIDAAIAEVDSKIKRIAHTPEGNTITGDRRPYLGQKVWKRGRTTELTNGVVTGEDVTIRVVFSQGRANFVKQIAITGEWIGQTPPVFADLGDSGSAVVDRDTNKVCAILIAVCKPWYVSFGTPFESIKTRLGVRIL